MSKYRLVPTGGDTFRVEQRRRWVWETLAVALSEAEGRAFIKQAAADERSAWPIYFDCNGTEEREA
jgi:hypothetical protein